MRRILVPTAFFLAFLAVGVLVQAQQTQQKRGRVVNRDGVAQAACRVEFRRSGPDLIYGATTNPEGYYFLDNPGLGTYSVTIKKDNRSATFDVIITTSGLNPATLIVRW